MSLEDTVLAATAGHDTIVVAVLTAVLVEQLEELVLSFFPVDGLFGLGGAAGVADSSASMARVTFLLSLVCLNSAVEAGTGWT